MEEIYKEEDAGTKKKSPFVAFIQKRKLLLILVAVALVLVVAASIILPTMSPEYIAKKYAIAIYVEDHAVAEKYCAFDYRSVWFATEDEAEEYFESASEWYQEDIKSWKDYYAVMKEAEAEDLYDTYGEYEISAEITRSKDLSMRKLEEEYDVDWLEEEGLFDLDSVTEAKLFTIKIKLEGEDEIVRDSFQAVVVKMGMNWKVLYFDDYNPY